MKRIFTNTFGASLVLLLFLALSACSFNLSPRHTHTNADPVHENEVAATCTSEGSYDEVIYCTDCKKEVERTSKSIDMLPHDYFDDRCTSCGNYRISAGLEFTFNNDRKSYYVSGIGTCTDENIVIPSTYNNLPVTAIGNGAFKDASNIVNVKIHNGIKSISNDAFRGCYNLMRITVPYSLCEIGDYAFLGCVRLVEIYNASLLDMQPGSDTNGRISYYAMSVYTDDETYSRIYMDEDGFVFYSDAGLKYLINYLGNETEITLPDIYEGEEYSIRDYSFYLCENIKTIKIPSEITHIGNHAFDKCSSLLSIDLPNGLTRICESTFSGCTSLTSIVIPYSVTVIESQAFYECKNLAEITFGENSKLEEIGPSAFASCEHLTNVILPEGVTSLGYYAFSECTNLISIRIPEGVTVLDQGVFKNCRGLSSVTLPHSLTNIESDTFSGCYSLAEVYNFSTLPIFGGTSYAGFVAFNALNIYTNDDVSSKILTDESGFIFHADGDICYLIGYIGDESAVTLPGDCGGKNYVLHKYLFAFRDDITEVIIPDNVTAIGECAFNLCANLKSIRISDSVTSIGEYAFNNCRSLENVEIGNGVLRISDAAFQECTSLSSLTLGESVTYIGHNSFADCTTISSLIVPDSVEYIGDDAFNGCTNLQSITLGNSLKSIGREAFSNCTNLFGLTIPNSVEHIGNYAFYKCLNLRTITIGSGITSIADSTFRDCKKLIEVYNLSALNITTGSEENGNVGQYAKKIHTDSTAPSGIITDESGYIFYYDGNTYYLIDYVGADTYVTLPESYCGKNYSILQYAFYGRTMTNVITISEYITDIGSHAFANCTNIERLVIGDNVTSIDICAFKDCDKLRSVVIGKSVNSIGNSAFESCDNLRSIYFKGSESEFSKFATNDIWHKIPIVHYFYYYSEADPGVNAKHWYYDKNGNIKIW